MDENFIHKFINRKISPMDEGVIHKWHPQMASSSVYIIYGWKVMIKVTNDDSVHVPPWSGWHQLITISFMDETPSSIDDINWWHFHPWMRFLHLMFLDQGCVHVHHPLSLSIRLSMNDIHRWKRFFSAACIILLLPLVLTYSELTCVFHLVNTLLLPHDSSFVQL